VEIDITPAGPRTEAPAPQHPDEGFLLTGPSTPIRQLVRDVWRSRALLVMLARKDFFVRYRRTLLGIGWAVGLPLVQAAVLTAVFSRVVHANRLVGTGRSYAVFLYAGLVPWTYLSSTLPAASTAIVDNLDLITKVYFPRVLTVVLAACSGLVPLGAGLVILLGLSTTLGPGLSVRTLWLLPGVALLVLLVVAFGALVSALHVYVRDLRYAVQAVMTVAFYATPVLYPVRAVPASLRDLVIASPAAGPIALFRRATGAADRSAAAAVLCSLVWLVVVGVAGLVLQGRRDRVFVDLL
jgi:ABC-type polysaccharide/polyol phosphate export permease